MIVTGTLLTFFFLALSETTTLPLETFADLYVKYFFLDLGIVTLTVSVVAFFLFWALTLTVTLAVLFFLTVTFFLAALALVVLFWT